MSSAGIAAAVVARARRQIQHHFFSEDAVRADRAVSFMPSNAFEARQFEKMLERGSIRREGADRYWIDVVAYDLDVQTRHRRVRTALLLVIIALAVALIANAVSGGHWVAP